MNYGEFEKDMSNRLNESSNFLGPLEQFPHMFIGREKELSALRKAFLQSKSQVVLVTGTVGSGKTALALEFARRYGNKFSGGIYQIPPMSSVSVFNKALEFIRQSSKPILVIFDEPESMPPNRIVQFVHTLKNERPSAKILFTSQLTSSSIFSDFFHLVDNIIKLEIEDSERRQRFRNDLSKLGIEDSIFAPTQSFTRPSIVGPDGHPLSKGSKSYKQIVSDVSEVSDELLSKLSRSPEMLYELSPRKFEEVVAEILHRYGYEITLTPFSKDGGIDICAASKGTLGTFLYLVQCKRYAPDHPVGVELVRELYGIVQLEKATAGIIAATSYFTKGAKTLQSQLMHQMTLKDYSAIQDWLKSVLR